MPPNVRVWSLGKETGSSRIKYVLKLYKYIWQLRNEYDGVFVHMNPIYVVLGGIFWRIWGKRIFLWYNHQSGTLIAKIGIKLANKVFYTSPFSFASKFKKAERMPAGIDTEVFRRNNEILKTKNSILYLGRISPIKNVNILIESANLLDKEGTDFILNIVGEPGEKDKEYFEEIKNLSRDLADKEKIRFLEKVPNYKTPKIYNQNEIFVNLSPPGSFDKTILEAMACETLVLVSNKTFHNVLSDHLIFKEKKPEDLKNKITNVFNMEKEEKEKLGRELRKYAVQNHSLDNLTEKVIKAFRK